MERAILVRHAESEFSAREAVNGDPAAPGALTETGREQAEALGTLLEDDAIDLCVTSEFARTIQTADIALAGRAVPRLVVPELNDIRVGRFEGGLLSEYRAWAHAHGPDDECPGGGESRAQAAHRFAVGFRIVLERPEATILVVSHSLPLRYLVGALVERDPTAIAEPVPYAEPQRITRGQLERAVARLEAWSRNPVFA